jgi:hypothetical protein
MISPPKKKDKKKKKQQPQSHVRICFGARQPRGLRYMISPPPKKKKKKKKKKNNNNLKVMLEFVSELDSLEALDT